MKPEKRRDLPYWAKPVKRITEKASPEKPRVDESKSGWWMALNSEDLEDYGAIFAEKGRTIDRAFVSVRNIINAEGEIEKTQIKRRFYVLREGAPCFVVDEDCDVVGPGMSSHSAGEID